MNITMSAGIRRLLALLALLAPLLMLAAPSAVSAYDDVWEEDFIDDYEFDTSTEGPGTRYLACRREATANYWKCRAPDYDSKVLTAVCYMAWDLDNIGCDLEFLDSTVGVIVRLLK